MSAERPVPSVVIVNWNGVHLLPACLEAVLAQELDGGFEVIVVDNASTDTSVALVRERYPEVSVIEASRNLGFAAGNNLAIRSRPGRDIVLLNSDAVPAPGWLAALAAAAAGERVGAATSRLMFSDRPDVIQNAGCMLLSDGSGADRGTGEVDRAQYPAGEVFGFCGAAAWLNRSALADVGPFDERFFMYYEDTDLSWRMRLRGWTIVYVPSATVLHGHATTSGEWSPFFTFHVDRNRLFTTLKNAPFGLVVRGYWSLVRRGRHRPAVAGPAAPPRPSPRARVLASFLWHLPGMVASRLSTRLRRTVPDRAILDHALPRAEWDAR